MCNYNNGNMDPHQLICSQRPVKQRSWTFDGELKTMVTADNTTSKICTLVVDILQRIVRHN